MKKKNRYQRQQSKYLQKKREQKIKEGPRKVDSHQLEQWKKELEPMVREVNQRIELIKGSGYTSYALDRIESETGRDYIDLESANTREKLLTEITRMRVFLGDKGSTVRGAELEMAQLSADKYIGMFGNQYNNKENSFKRFNTSVINEELAKKAFASYRRIEEHRASEIKNGSKAAYGSDNLIALLYDAEVQGKDSQMYGEKILDIFKGEDLENDKMRSDADNVTAISGIIEDNIRGGLIW